MYIPPAFAEDRPDELREMIAAASLPVLVSAGEGGLVATHLPLTLVEDRLIGHFAKANPYWKGFDPAVESVAIFVAADGYVSPSWYATKGETGKVVPTWNYEAVHAYGRLEIFEAPADILPMFVGHYFEGRKPAFLDDVMGLAIGPLFVVAEVCFLAGWRGDVRRAVEARVGERAALMM